MKNIRLIRIDDRLIHGQVVTSWITQTGSKKIIIIDDELYENEFLRDVFAAAAPRGIPVEVMNVEQAAQEWKLNEFHEEPVLILLKKIDALKRLYEQGFFFDNVQIQRLLCDCWFIVGIDKLGTIISTCDFDRIYSWID